MAGGRGCQSGKKETYVKLETNKQKEYYLQTRMPHFIHNTQEGPSGGSTALPLRSQYSEI